MGHCRKEWWLVVFVVFVVIWKQVEQFREKASVALVCHGILQTHGCDLSTPVNQVTLLEVIWVTKSKLFFMKKPWSDYPVSEVFTFQNSTHLSHQYSGKLHLFLRSFCVRRAVISMFALWWRLHKGLRCICSALGSWTLFKWACDLFSTQGPAFLNTFPLLRDSVRRKCFLNKTRLHLHSLRQIRQLSVLVFPLPLKESWNSYFIFHSKSYTCPWAQTNNQIWWGKALLLLICWSQHSGLPKACVNAEVFAL